jgi:hypothetical protein
MERRAGPVVGSSKHGNEPSDSIERRVFIDLLSNCQLFEKDFASLS